MAATATPPKAQKEAAPVDPAPVYGGQITLPGRCKPSKVCSSDQTRPLLTHGYLHRRADGSLWVCATDSYCLVAVKVNGDAEPGFIPIGALRLMERGQKAEQISGHSWKVATREGDVTFDCEPSVKGAVNFPDFEKLSVWDGHEATKTDEDLLKPQKGRLNLGFNPEIAKKVADGLGAGNYGCRYEVVGPLRPIRVFPLQSMGGERIGLQMPIRLNV